MKKCFRLMIIMLSVFLLTGCMKVEFSIGIDKNGAMNFQIIEAFNKSMIDSSNVTESNFKELEKQGFYIQKYEEEDMNGYKITKSYENINIFSKENEDFICDFNTFLNDGKGALFTVEKGFFKNKYSAKLNISSDNYDGGFGTIEGETEDYQYDNDYSYDSENDFNFDDFDSSNDYPDYSQMMANMELDFVVNLPYKAVSNNATNVSNGGKTLTWDLINHKAETLDFEFELYNMTNVYIVCGGILLVVIVLMILIFKSINNKTSNKSNNTNYNINDNNVNVKSANYGSNDDFNSQIITNPDNIKNNNINSSDVNDANSIDVKTTTSNVTITNSFDVEDKSFLISSSNTNNDISDQTLNTSLFNLSSNDDTNINSKQNSSSEVFGIESIQYMETSSSNGDNLVSGEVAINNVNQNSSINNSIVTESLIPTLEPLADNNLDNDVVVDNNEISQNNTNLLHDNNIQIQNDNIVQTNFVNEISATEAVIPTLEPLININLNKDGTIDNSIQDNTNN